MRFSRCKRKSYETPVQNGLGLTPKQMAELTNKGIPISANNLGLSYQDGVQDSDFTVPMEHTRGVDLADLWNSAMDGKAKAKEVYHKVVGQKGEQ